MSKQRNDTKAIRWNRKALVEVYTKGIDGGFRREILTFAHEAYQSYISGLSRAPIIMAAEALHRINGEIILQYTRATGKVEYKLGRKTWRLKREEVQPDFKAAIRIMKETTLRDTIHILRENKVIDEQTFLDMNALRHLRNEATHAFLLSPVNPANKPLAKEDLPQVLEEMWSNEFLPLKYRQKEFPININGKSQKYIVDQVRLGIELKNVEYQRWHAVIALGLLSTILRTVNKILPLY